MAGVIGAGAGNDGDLALHPLNGELQHLAVLVVGEGRGLAGGGADHNGGDAGGNLPINQIAKSLVVHALFVHGRDDGGCRTRKNMLLFHKDPHSFVESVMLLAAVNSYSLYYNTQAQTGQGVECGFPLKEKLPAKPAVF